MTFHLMSKQTFKSGGDLFDFLLETTEELGGRQRRQKVSVEEADALLV